MKDIDILIKKEFLDSLVLKESKMNLFSKVTSSLPNSREKSNARGSRVDRDYKNLAKDLGLVSKPSDRSDIGKIVAIINKTRTSNEYVSQTFGKPTIVESKILVPLLSISKGWSAKFLQLIIICAIKNRILELADKVSVSIEAEGGSLRIILTQAD
jgi:hypothetical protein